MFKKLINFEMKNNNQIHCTGRSPVHTACPATFLKVLNSKDRHTDKDNRHKHKQKLAFTPHLCLLASFVSCFWFFVTPILLFLHIFIYLFIYFFWGVHCLPKFDFFFFFWLTAETCNFFFLILGCCEKMADWGWTVQDWKLMIL